MPYVTPAPPRLQLTRRGRLVRSLAVLVLAIVLIIALVAIVRAVGSIGAPAAAGASPAAASEPSAEHAPSDGGGAGEDDAKAEKVGTDDAKAEKAGTDGVKAETDATAEATSGDAEEDIHRSGDVGKGTWTVAEPVKKAPPTKGEVRTYAVRIEDGLDISPDEATTKISRILADDRGWQDIEKVTFQQVSSPKKADFTISLGSPPTVDEMCLPAKTGGLWNCRVGSDVVLNSDRWLYATPTFEDLSGYRTYMINHEVGHYLGHDHERCGGKDEVAPVMLQQSMSLDGCTPNPWPAKDAGR